MNALLLAAGFGKRLWPITSTTPKCLVKISGKPLLQIWLENLSSSIHIEKIFVNTHYLADEVEVFISELEGPLKKKTVLLHEEELLGTAGTVRKLLPLVRDKPLLMAHADNLSLFSLNDFVKTYLCRPPTCEMTMMTFNSETPTACGILTVDSNNILTSFVEKPTRPESTCANAAVFIISPRGLEELKSMENAVDFSIDIVPKFIRRINTWHNTVYHRDIGTLDALEKARSDWRSIIKKVIL